MADRRFMPGDRVVGTLEGHVTCGLTGTVINGSPLGDNLPAVAVEIDAPEQHVGDRVWVFDPDQLRLLTRTGQEGSRDGV